MDQDHHSSDSPLEPWVDPALEARLVALILGEASEFEKAELLSAIDSQPELKAFYERIKGTHRALELAESPAHSDTESSWKLPPAKREALLERFRSPADSAPLSASATEPVARRRRRVAPWLAIAAAAALLMVTVIPLTLTRRAMKAQTSEVALLQSASPESEMLERSKHFDRYDLAQLAVDARDIAQVARAQDGEKIGRLSRPASSLESLAQVDSDSKDGEESPATWGRFGNVAAWRKSEVAEKAVAHDSFFVDPGSSDGWEQGISLAKNPQIITDEGRSVASFAVTSEPSQLNFVADGGMTPAINGALNNDPSSPQQWGAKTDAALPSPALRSPRGSASPEAAATLEYNAGTAGTDRLASTAVAAPVAYGEEFVEFDQTIPQPDALGEIAQVETASASDEGFVSGGTKAYYKMPAGGRRFRAKTAPTDPPSPPTEDLALDLVEQIRPAGDSEAKREAVTKEQLAHTFEDQSRPAIGLGMEVTPPPAPEPIAELFATVPDPPVYAGGVAVPVDENARGFVSASGVATGFSMLDKFAAPETSSPSPASSDDPFSSEAEGMDLAEVNSLRLQSQIYSEGEHGDVVAGISGGGFGGGGIGGGGARVGSQQESQQALGQEVAQQRALYDHFARDFGKDGAETAAGTPFVSTITADFGWDSQPGLVTSLREAPTEEEPTAMHWAMPAPVERATRLAGDPVTQEADAGVAIQPGFGASIPGSESILSRRLVEAEISQYGSEQDEAKLVEVLKSTKELAKADQFSVSTNGKVRGLGTLSLGDDERSREHLAPFGDSLADAGNVDGTVRMLSLAGQIDGEDNSATVEQRLAAALQTEESEEEEKEVTRGGQVNTRFSADTSYDRKLALPEMKERWEAGDAILGLSDAAAVASGGSEVAEANRPEGTESSWYDFDVDTPGKEVTGLAARNLIAGEQQDGLDIAGAVEIEELREKKFADFTGANFSRSSRSTATVAEPVSGAIVVDSKREEAVAEAQPLIEESLTVANERVSALRSETRKQSSDKSDEQAQLGKLAASKSKRAKAKPDLSLETLTSAEPFSTFSLNVSDVSFKLAKTALLDNNSFPDSTKVRVEEFVNAFDYGDPSPSLNEKVACHIDQSAHPFLQQRNLMRISMQTAAEGRAASQPLRLTILLDKSGSMERADREESVLRTMQALSTHLGPADTITAVAFARQPHLIADQLSGDRAVELVGLVAATPSEGGTNLEEALALADTLATRQFDDGAINRIVLITDGAANLGDADPESLKEKVSELRQRGIAFDACGVGANGLNDTTLEALTRKGDGRYYFLNRPQDADTKFVRQLAGALRPAAKNVKVQVKFNPERVTRYRLAGFEKHRLNKEDFRNDKVDAAEMAAAESGNALYQFEADPQGSGDVGEVSVRFLDTSSGKMVERSWPIPYQPKAPRLGEASPAMQLAATAGLLGEKLKGGPSSEAIVLGDLAPVTNQLRTEFADDQEVQQLLQMVEAARSLTGQ